MKIDDFKNLIRDKIDDFEITDRNSLSLQKGTNKIIISVNRDDTLNIRFMEKKGRKWKGAFVSYNPCLDDGYIINKWLPKSLEVLIQNKFKKELEKRDQNLIEKIEW